MTLKTRHLKKKAKKKKQEKKNTNIYTAILKDLNIYLNLNIYNIYTHT